MDTVVELPEDIVIEILYRLPVKSLLTFKTVRKSWCSIINSLPFVKKQLNYAHSKSYNQHKDILGLLPCWDDRNRCVLYNHDPDSNTMHAKKITLPFKVYDVCNYCDGLICLLTPEHNIFLWNPSFPTDYYKIIPMETEDPESFWVGMGYDSVSDDYKIVRIPELICKDSTYFFVEVFSQKSSSWSKSEISQNFTYDLPRGECFYTRNRLHWVSRCYQTSKAESIVYFDMVDERLDRINVPCNSERILHYKETIAIIDDNTLWCLVDYNGMNSSWKKFKFPRRTRHPPLVFHLCFTSDGKSLIQALSFGGLKTHDFENGLFSRVQVFGDDLIYQSSALRWFYVSPYVESLVSPRWFD